MSNRDLPAALLAAMLVGPAAARAQSLDYSGFEQLFGEPVTTSATGQPQRVSEAPANITVITADDIRRSGADTIPDVLRFVAGIDVRQYGQLDAAVGIRGDNTALNPRVLVLLDGREVYDDSYGQVIWATIPVPLTAIRQIEIIKGPNAALYGFNAVAGVINIVTVDPLRHQGFVGAADAGSLSQAAGNGAATVGVPGRYGVRLAATGFHADEFTGGAAADGREAPRSGTVSLDGRVQVTPTVEWDASGSFGTLQSDYFVDLGQYTPLFTHENDLRTELRAATAVGVLDADVYRNENDLAENDPIAPIRFRNDVLVARLSDLVQVGRTSIVRVAGEYRRNTISGEQAFSGTLGYDDVAGSAMWAWQLTPHFSLTNAVRVDALSLGHDGAQFLLPTGAGGLYRARSITEPSFNTGAVLAVTSLDTVRLIGARAVQLPSLVDLGLGTQLEGGAIVLTGSPALEPAAVTNLEADYDRALPAMDATLRLATFAQHTDTTIGSPFGSGFGFLPTGQVYGTARNFGASDEAGGELELKGGRHDRVHWMLGYALAAVHDATAPALLAAAPSVSYAAQTPTSSVVFGAGTTFGRLALDLSGRWQSHYDDDLLDPLVLAVRQVLVRNYVTVDARAGYRLTRQVELTASAAQLLDRQLVESAGVPVDRRFLAGVRVGL